MTDQNFATAEPAAQRPRWQAVGAIDRRVAGVLAEKAKTTPDGYPMSLNAIRNACNQKSNRFPAMNLEAEDVEESLDRLRELGAVGMIEGYGRVAKYRHYLYEWLGVDKVELAVMAELLLRGPQTEGALRGRAARMEPIRDLGALRPVLASLKAKGLMISLTPEGRGHVVTHALFQPGELERVKAEYGGERRAESGERRVQSGESRVESQEWSAERGEEVPSGSRLSALDSQLSSHPPVPAPAAIGVDAEEFEGLRRELAELRAQVAQWRSDLEEVCSRQDRVDDEMRGFRDALGG